MADAEWYEIPGDAGEFPNLEAATAAARVAAASTDDCVEIYQHTSTRVRTVQRAMTIQETDVTA